MTTKDQAIRNPHPSELRRTRPIHEAVGASPQPPAPDCRTCTHFYACCNYRIFDDCTNGDQYQPAPAVVCKHFRRGVTNKTAAECPYCEIETLRAIEPMNEVAHRFAHPLALELECVLADRPGYYDKAMQVLSEYRSAMNAIHEQHSPTFMGEPLIAQEPKP